MTIVDEISPLDYGENRIDLQLETSDPRVGEPVVVNVDASRADPDGLKLPLEFTVTSQSGAAVFHRQVFRSVVPTRVSFRPSEGGSVLFRVAELFHNKWFGALPVDVAGDVLELAPRRNPRVIQPAPEAVFPSTPPFSLGKVFDSDAPNAFLEAPGIYFPGGANAFTVAGWLFLRPSGGSNGNNAWRQTITSGSIRNGFTFGRSAPGGRWFFQVEQSAFNRNRTESTNFLDYPSGGWVHAVCIYPGTLPAAGMQVWIDGVAEPMTVLESGYNGALLEGTRFCMDYNAGIDQWDGLQANVTVLPYAASPAQVAELYNGGDPDFDLNESSMAGTASLWVGPSNDDTDPNAIADMSGSGNDLVGSAMAFNSSNLPP